MQTHCQRCQDEQILAYLRVHGSETHVHLCLSMYVCVCAQSLPHPSAAHSLLHMTLKTKARARTIQERTQEEKQAGQAGLELPSCCPTVTDQ